MKKKSLQGQREQAYLLLYKYRTHLLQNTNKTNPYQPISSVRGLERKEKNTPTFLFEKTTLQKIIPSINSRIIFLFFLSFQFFFLQKKKKKPSQQITPSNLCLPPPGGHTHTPIHIHRETCKMQRLQKTVFLSMMGVGDFYKTPLF